MISLSSYGLSYFTTRLGHLFFVLIKVFFSNQAKNLGKYPEASSFSNYSYYISYSNGISDNASSSFIEPSVGIVYS